MVFLCSFGWPQTHSSIQSAKLAMILCHCLSSASVSSVLYIDHLCNNNYKKKLICFHTLSLACADVPLTNFVFMIKVMTSVTHHIGKTK